MKSLLVLYPIQPYTEHLVFSGDSAEIKIKYADTYQRLIYERYPDFQLIWTMFSESQSKEKPDMSLLWKGVSFKNGDIVWACGVSFDEHCKKEYIRIRKISFQHVRGR